MNYLVDVNNRLNKSIKNKDNERVTLLTYLAEGVNCKDNKKSKIFMKITEELHSKKIIKNKEYRIIINPPFQFNRSDFEQAIKHINEENEKAVKEFYQMNSNHSNYEI